MNKLRNFIWVIGGIILMSILVMSTTTINDNLLSSSGNVTLSSGILSITNPTTSNGILLDQNGDTSVSTSTGGALRLDMTGSAGSGLIIYSNKGASTGGARLFNIRADNALYDGRGLSVDYDGVGRAVFFDNRGTGTANSALEASSTNPQASAVGISGNETGHGTLKIIHNYPGENDENAAGLSIDIAGLGTAAQGLFITSNGNTTGDLIDVRNRGFFRFRVLNDTGIIISQNRSVAVCDGANEGGVYYDAETKKHYGCNVTAWQPLY